MSVDRYEMFQAIDTTMRSHLEQEHKQDLRMQIAIAAMQGMLANPNLVGWCTQEVSDYALDKNAERQQIVFRAFMMADMMIAEAGKER